MKNYNDFFASLIKELDEKKEIISTKFDELRVYKKGFKGDNEKDNAFVKSTNLKYFDSENDVLLGDFIEIITCSEHNKESFLRFSVSDLYDALNHGICVFEYMEEQLKYAHNLDGSLSFIDNIENYNIIKDSLIIRPLNYTLNKHILDDYVYDLVGDIALVLYAIVLDDKENGILNTAKIPKSVFDTWKIDREELFEHCISNSMKFAKPKIYTDILNVNDTSDEMSNLLTADFSLEFSDIPLVTTSRKTNGAIALFYPNVKEKLAEMFDDDFYVAFTSIHEGMIHKANTISPKEIKRHIIATNNAFGSEETLTNNVYMYSRKNKTFTVVA